MIHRISVALPLPLDQLFSYSVPERLTDRAKPGYRAVVPFGNRTLTGIIVDGKCNDIPEEDLREINDLPDDKPILPGDILELTRWVSQYYFCSWGEVLKAALPAGFLQTATLNLLRESVTPAKSTSVGKLIMYAEEREKKAPKQAEILRVLASDPEKQWITAELLKRTGAGRQSLLKLVEAGILDRNKVRIKRYPTLDLLTPQDNEPLPVPNTDQQKAISTIAASIKEGSSRTFLLYGVTGSGKTLVYQKTIEQVLDSGGTALVLIPEISLTPQIVSRFRAQFGNRIALQHSAMSIGERADVWQGIRASEFSIVIGARSAVFAPLDNLRLIIVDEEGDASFKQNEPNPRYHARDIALVRAKMAGATTVLGSATPSMESFNNAMQKRFALLELPERIDKVPPPVIHFVPPARRRNKIIGEILEKSLTERLLTGEQVILLHNRRGFFTYVFCPKCGYVCTCKNCEITLTYHKKEHKLRCHICGYKISPPGKCPECEKPLQYAGTGTQRIEEELEKLVDPEKIVRLDLDTTGQKGSHHRILKSFANEEKAILLGTKMVARGHDYPRVTLVGVASADIELAFPDFRSDERAFVLLLQAAGRAGRSAGDSRPGEVLIQTWMPDHPVLEMVKTGDYQVFYDYESNLRRNLKYPPWGWMILFVFSSIKQDKALDAAGEFIQRARRHFKEGDWMGPAPAFRPRLKNQYRYQVILKTAVKSRSIHSTQRQKIKTLIEDTRRSLPTRVQMIVDVDPIQLM